MGLLFGNWLLFLDVVIWSDATKIGSQHWLNARSPAHSRPWSARRDYKFLRTLRPSGLLFFLRKPPHQGNTKHRDNKRKQKKQPHRVRHDGPLSNQDSVTANYGRLRPLGKVQNSGVRASRVPLRSA